MVLDYNAPGVHSYLQILQSVINRMAANSAAAKTWCIALVSALLVVIVERGTTDYIWIVMIPISLFLFLDVYYLGLERRFRDQYNAFIEKLHAGQADASDLYILAPGHDKDAWGRFCDFAHATGEAVFSLSVWPFYSLLIVLLAVVRLFVLPALSTT